MKVVIDCGGTNIRIGFFSNNTPTFELIKISSQNNFDKDIESIIKAIEGRKQKIQSIVLGFAGAINLDSGEVISSENLSSWEGKNPLSKLYDKFGCNIYVLNDSQMAAYCEVTYGLENKNDYIFLTWGTGIGAGIFEFVEPNSFSIFKIDWTKYLEKFELNLGGRNIEKRIGKSLSELNEKEWDEVLKSFCENLLDLSSKLSINQVFISGGIVEKQRERINSFIVQNKLQNIHLSSHLDESGIVGGYYFLNNQKR